MFVLYKKMLNIFILSVNIARILDVCKVQITPKGERGSGNAKTENWLCGAFKGELEDSQDILPYGLGLG